MCGLEVLLLVELGFGAGLLGSDRRLHVDPWLLDAADAVLLHHKKSFVGMVAAANWISSMSQGPTMRPLSCQGRGSAYMLISSVASLPTMCRIARRPPG